MKSLGFSVTRRLGYILGALLAGCETKLSQPEPPAVPDRVERQGEIEVVTHTRHSLAANYDRYVNDEAWSLRWQGQPLDIDSLGGMWLDQPMRTSKINTVFVVGAGEHPDLIVNVGDPNNASVFHLLRQDGGQLSTPVLCKAFGANNAVQVLDGKGAGSVFEGPNYTSLAGAGRLLLGRSCIYEVATRQVRVIPPEPGDVYFTYRSGGMVVSPDGLSFARVAVQSESKLPVMLVAELDGEVWTRLPIDLRRMRYSDVGTIDAAWVEHHFEWQRGAGGRDRLAERADFKPLPRRGSFLDGVAQYDIRQAVSARREELGEFLVRRFQGRRLPPEPNSVNDVLFYEVEQEVVNVSGASFFISLSSNPYWPGQPGDPERQKQLIRRIGAAFDAELAEGRHEALFIEVPDESWAQ
jgi:hypothetical protein